MGVGEDVPTIPAQETADIDAKTAQHQRRRGKQPTNTHTPAPRHQHLHPVQRQKAEEQPGEGKGEEHDGVVPQRRIGRRAQMDEVGDQVRSIGQKQEPQRPHAGQ